MRARILLAGLLVVSATALLAESTMADPASVSARPSVVVRSSQLGPIVFDGANRALYAFTRDQAGRSTCFGACAAAWPPYVVRGTLRAGKGTRRSLLGTTRRRDGTRQLTYAGKPLYYYVGDPVGEVRCQNVREFGGLWLVVRPSGRLVR
jgi:predicted lipoprotein with Yx(FWY)xxD motif